MKPWPWVTIIPIIELTSAINDSTSPIIQLRIKRCQVAQVFHASSPVPARMSGRWDDFLCIITITFHFSAINIELDGFFVFRTYRDSVVWQKDSLVCNGPYWHCVGQTKKDDEENGSREAQEEERHPYKRMEKREANGRWLRRPQPHLLLS